MISNNRCKQPIVKHLCNKCCRVTQVHLPCVGNWGRCLILEPVQLLLTNRLNLVRHIPAEPSSAGGLWFRTHIACLRRWRARHPREHLPKIYSEVLASWSSWLPIKEWVRCAYLEEHYEGSFFWITATGSSVEVFSDNLDLKVVTCSVKHMLGWPMEPKLSTIPIDDVLISVFGRLSSINATEASVDTIEVLLDSPPGCRARCKVRQIWESPEGPIICIEEFTVGGLIVVCEVGGRLKVDSGVAACVGQVPISAHFVVIPSGICWAENCLGACVSHDHCAHHQPNKSGLLSHLIQLLSE